MASFECNVSSPWFEHIVAGSKTVEGRLFKGTFSQLSPGAVLTINGQDERRVVAKVLDVVRYGSFNAYLTGEGLGTTLPGVLTVEEGVDIYRQFYSEEQERTHGVVAVRIQV